MSENDLIEEIIGGFGRYQTWILVMVSVAHLASDFQLNNVLFVLPNVDYVCLDDDAFNVTNHCPCKTPEFDRSDIFESATSEWNLICGRRFLASLAQSLMMAGMLSGSILYGYLSDRFGRRIALALAFISQPLFGTVNALVTEYWMFTIFRFLAGNALGGVYVTSYVLMMELSGKSFRPYLSGLFEIAPATSIIFLPVIAYFLRDWRHLQLATATPWFLVIVYYLILPESPRWLITVGRKKEAVDVLTYIAKKNKRPTENIANIVNIIEKESKCEGNDGHASYIDLFKTSKIRKYTIINGFMWLCCAHAYFGISQYIGRLNGNIYLNVLLNGVFLLPALAVIVVCALLLKRKKVIIMTFVLSGLCMLAFILVPAHMQAVANTFAILGQLASYNSFILIYLYTTEVFPTVVRNSAIGFASMCARVGGLVAPFVVNIGIEWVSMTILSVLTFLAALLCCMLPETKDTVLLNSIEQTEKKSNNIN